MNTRNYWIEREAAEEELLRDYLQQFVLFCWHCFHDGADQPSDTDAYDMVDDVLRMYKDDVADL